MRRSLIHKLRTNIQTSFGLSISSDSVSCHAKKWSWSIKNINDFQRPLMLFLTNKELDSFPVIGYFVNAWFQDDRFWSKSEITIWTPWSGRTDDWFYRISLQKARIPLISFNRNRPVLRIEWYPLLCPDAIQSSIQGPMIVVILYGPWPQWMSCQGFGICRLSVMTKFIFLRPNGDQVVFFRFHFPREAPSTLPSKNSGFLTDGEKKLSIPNHCMINGTIRRMNGTRWITAYG